MALVSAAAEQGKGAGLTLFYRKPEPLRYPCASLGALIGVSLPTGVTVHVAAPWALGFAAVATGTALCVVLVVSVLWQKKVSAMHEITALQ